MQSMATSKLQIIQGVFIESPLRPVALRVNLNCSFFIKVSEKRVVENHSGERIIFFAY